MTSSNTREIVEPDESRQPTEARNEMDDLIELILERRRPARRRKPATGTVCKRATLHDRLATNDSTTDGV